MFFGIDPGGSGAITAIWPDGEPATQFCKLKETGHDIVDYLKQFDLSNSHAVIESVHAMPKQGVSSTFAFGKSFGFCLGVLSALEIPFLLVTPLKWQNAMGCRTRGDKNISKAAAQQRWPKLKITHANADSLLLAEYGRTVLWK
jgi:hypothetical protein